METRSEDREIEAGVEAEWLVCCFVIPYFVRYRGADVAVCHCQYQSRFCTSA